MKLRWLVGLTVLLAAHFASASKSNEDPGDGSLKRWILGDKSQQAIPVEDEFSLPDLARLKDWHVYPVGREMGLNRVEIAADSISVGKNDEIVRYAIAIVTPSGVRNVRFEGLDCSSSRYRMYAIGQTEPTWKKIDTLVWQIAQTNVRNVWQGQLLKDFCGMSGPYKTEVLVKAVQQGEAPAKPK